VEVEAELSGILWDPLAPRRWSAASWQPDSARNGKRARDRRPSRSGSGARVARCGADDRSPHVKEPDAHGWLRGPVRPDDYFL
jgi:hypothetical protein